jgi:hypothetical protein
METRNLALTLLGGITLCCLGLSWMAVDSWKAEELDEARVDLELPVVAYTPPAVANVRLPVPVVATSAAIIGTDAPTESISDDPPNPVLYLSRAVKVYILTADLPHRQNDRDVQMFREGIAAHPKVELVPDPDSAEVVLWFMWGGRDEEVLQRPGAPKHTSGGIGPNEILLPELRQARAHSDAARQPGG